MVSINRRVLYGEVYNDVRCLSTDQKPTENIKNGSVLYEIDTGRKFLFDAGLGVWHRQPESGGSGGLTPMTTQEVHEITGGGI